jgi:hypothetical protein
MMPPNAQNIGTTAAAEITTPSATNTAYLPAFSDDAVDHSLAEVAKTFNWREFGNGSANGNASYLDFSTTNNTSGGDDRAYVMDDGLTSMSGDDVYVSGTKDIVGWDTGDGNYITFIGTGISFKVNSGTNLNFTHAQNLPYGTHILKSYRASGGGTEIIIDGVTIVYNPGNQGQLSEVSFHQPKMPPIPEDAVVIADYMLMADFVAQTSNGIEKLSKGTRLLSCSRDVYYDAAGVFTFTQGLQTQSTGFKFYRANDNSAATKVPFFGNGIVHKHESNTGDGATLDFTNDGTNFSGGTFFGEASSNQLVQTSATTQGVYGGIHSLTTGSFTAKFDATQTDKNYRGSAYEIVSPIHTSSHYQTFETPFLHELVGGDRNMEQNNLVVTPDGKTWDEVTRDTSYMGNMVVSGATDTAYTWSNVIKLDEWRGVNGQANSAPTAYFNKDFAIAYDKVICLVDGWYRIKKIVGESSAADYHAIAIDASDQYAMVGRFSAANESGAIEADMFLKRGQSVFYLGNNKATKKYFKYTIERL